MSSVLFYERINQTSIHVEVQGFTKCFRKCVKKKAWQEVQHPLSNHRQHAGLIPGFSKNTLISFYLSHENNAGNFRIFTSSVVLRFDWLFLLLCSFLYFHIFTFLSEVYRRTQADSSNAFQKTEFIASFLSFHWDKFPRYIVITPWKMRAYDFYSRIEQYQNTNEWA